MPQAELLTRRGVVCLTILAPVMFYVPVGQQVNASAADALVPLLALHVIASRMKLPQFAIAYSFLFVVSLVLSSSLASLLGGETVNTQSGILAIAKVSFCLAAFATYAALLIRSGTTRVACGLWALVGVGISGLTLLEAFGSIGVPLVTADGTRVNGTFEDPNLFGTYLVTCLAVVPSLPRSRVLRIASFGVLGLALISTGSRGAVLSALVVVFLFPVLTPQASARVRQLAFALFTGIAVLASLNVVKISLPGLERLGEASVDTTRDVRFVFWREAIATWERAPLFGIGPGQFEIDGRVAHNTFLSLLAENGLFGLCVFSLLMATLTVKLWRLRADPLARSVLLGSIALAIQMLSLNLQNVRFVWMFLALGVAVVVDRSVRGVGPSEARSGRSQL